MKKILLVDDSALMRRVLCDIINNDSRFQVVDRATNGVEAFDFLSRNTYDAVVLDVNMPKMNGLELLKELRKYKIKARVMMASTYTKEGAKVTMEALELGALDFVHKPENAFECKKDDFSGDFLRVLNGVANARIVEPVERSVADIDNTRKIIEIAQRNKTQFRDRRIVAIASSTGGPKALQGVIPLLPKNLSAPVVVVQHMPKGFTDSFAKRLDATSPIAVKEAEDGEELQNGCVYIAQGGMHLNVVTSPGGRATLRYSDEPTREGVKPCANYMYESLAKTSFDYVLCVVLTGMGADGTEGISNLKKKKKIDVIAQDQNSCVVYGMPRSVVNAKLADQVLPLDKIAQEIIVNMGVK